MSWTLMKGRLQVHTGFLQSIQGKLTWGHSSALNTSTPLTICLFEKFLSILCPGFVSDVTFKYHLITSGFTAEINHKFSLRVQVVKNVHNKNPCILKWWADLKFKQIFGIDDFNSFVKKPSFFQPCFPITASFVAFLSEFFLCQPHKLNCNGKQREAWLEVFEGTVNGTAYLWKALLKLDQLLLSEKPAVAAPSEDEDIEVCSIT